MTLFRSKSLGEELIGRTQRIAGAVAGRHPREALGAAREYSEHAGALASQVIGKAGRGLGRHPRLGIAIGVGAGLGAIAAAYLLSRRRTRLSDDHDERDPTRETQIGDNAQDGSAGYSPVPGETGLY